MTYLSYYLSPIGKLAICANSHAITEIRLAEEIQEKNYTITKTPLLLEATHQLDAYFKNKRTFFELPLEPEGTPFQKKVWEALKQIPYGTTSSYKEIACMIGHPQAYRAVGNANHCNPIMIVIPCHRVLTSQQKLGGYRGGAAMKQYLIELERENMLLNI